MTQRENIKEDLKTKKNVLPSCAFEITSITNLRLSIVIINVMAAVQYINFQRNLSSMGYSLNFKATSSHHLSIIKSVLMHS